MRTNVEIDDELMRQAIAASGKSSKKAVVTDALRLVVQLKRQAKICELFGTVQWVGDLDQMRASRFPDWDSNVDPKRKSINEPAA